MEKMKIFLMIGVILLIPLLIVPATSAGVVLGERIITEDEVNAGSSTSVTLTITSNQNSVQAPTLDENPSGGLTISGEDVGDGIFKSSTSECIWKEWLNNSESRTITYDINVPSDTPSGTYNIEGFASAYNDAPSAIIGDSTITVTNWVDIYDKNNNGITEKEEAVKAITDYLLYGTISKQVAVLVLNSYFGL
jgi:hypothetical protein